MAKIRFNLTDPRYAFAFQIQDLARMMRRAFLERSAKFGVTQVQARALAALSRMEGATQVELARHLDLHPMTFARLLDRMAKLGLIERRRDPKDRRVFRIYLGPQATPVLSHMASVSEDLRDISLAGFAATEHDLLVRYLDRMKTNMTESSAKARRAKAGAA